MHGFGLWRETGGNPNRNKKNMQAPRRGPLWGTSEAPVLTSHLPCHLKLCIHDPLSAQQCLLVLLVVNGIHIELLPWGNLQSPSACFWTGGRNKCAHRKWVSKWDDTSIWEEIPVLTQDTLERSHFLTGLGPPWSGFASGNPGPQSKKGAHKDK